MIRVEDCRIGDRVTFTSNGKQRNGRVEGISLEKGALWVLLYGEDDRIPYIWYVHVSHVLSVERSPLLPYQEGDRVTFRHLGESRKGTILETREAFYFLQEEDGRKWHVPQSQILGKEEASQQPVKEEQTVSVYRIGDRVTYRFSGDEKNGVARTETILSIHEKESSYQVRNDVTGGEYLVYHREILSVTPGNPPSPPDPAKREDHSFGAYVRDVCLALSRGHGWSPYSTALLYSPSLMVLLMTSWGEGRMVSETAERIHQEHQENTK